MDSEMRTEGIRMAWKLTGTRLCFANYHIPRPHISCIMVVRILEPLKNSVSFGPITKGNLWIWKHFKNRWSDLQTLGVQSSLRSEGEYFCPKISDDLPSFAGIMSCAWVFDKNQFEQKVKRNVWFHWLVMSHFEHENKRRKSHCLYQFRKMELAV